MERRGLISEKAWAALLFAGLALTPPYAQAQSNPSFDCRRATTAVEKLICSDSALGDLDRKMAETFRQILKSEPASSRDAIVKAQLRWLQDRAIGCGLDPNQPAFHRLDAPPPSQCLAETYRQWDQLGHVPYVPLRRTELPIETNRQPFLPRLLVSRDAKLCDAFLSGLRKDFLARHRNGNYAFKEPPMTLGHWVAWPSEHGSEQLRESIDVAELDLDQDGRKQLLLHVTQPFNSNNNSYDLLIRSKTTTDGIAAEILALQKSWPNRKTSTLVSVAAAPRFSPLGDGYKSPFKVLSYQGRVYVYDVADGVTAVGGNDRQDGTASLQRIHADGSTELRCQASIAPRAGALPLPWPTRSPDELEVPAEVVGWMRTIREIQGTEGQMAGTLHALSGLITRSAYTWYDTLVRPWEVAASRPPYQPPPLFMRAWIHQWGYQSLSRFRLARAFEARRLAAMDALARYYEHAFGLPNGKEAALLTTDRIISASFVVHIEKVPSDEELRREIHRSEGQRGDLCSALLTGTPQEALNALIKEGAPLSGDKGSGTEGREPALFYALEHPDEVRLLLDRGADINEGNAFGKTALMYAAHYDLADTVTLLLARGADVAKRTDARNVPEATMIRFDSRIALMYAAENASERVIRELILAGSDTCATDSGDRDVWDYALRNERLSNDARARVALLIAQKPCDRAGQSDRAR